MWQLYRKWKLIIPAVAPREEVLTSCRPTAPPHQYQARAKLLRSTVRMGAFAWPQQLGPVCFPVTSEQHVPFSPPSVWVIQHTQVSWSCRVCACPGDSLSLILVVWKCTLGHITNTPRSARWAVCSHSPEQAMCFWSRPVMGHDNSLTLDPTHTLAVHTRLQTCPSFFRSYAHFSHEREIFLVMWWQRHCKVTQKEWQGQMNLSDMPNFVCRSQDDLSTENTV